MAFPILELISDIYWMVSHLVLVPSNSYPQIRPEKASFNTDLIDAIPKLIPPFSYLARKHSCFKSQTQAITKKKKKTTQMLLPTPHSSDPRHLRSPAQPLLYENNPSYPPQAHIELPRPYFDNLLTTLATARFIRIHRSKAFRSLSSGSTSNKPLATAISFTTHYIRKKTHLISNKPAP